MKRPLNLFARFPVRHTFIVLVCALPLAALGQQLPYTQVKGLQQCADKLSAASGVKAELTLEHSDPLDKRPFKIFLDGPQGRTEIQVQTNGCFHLPPVPQAEEAQTQLMHTLEKGALTLSLGLHTNFAGPKQGGYGMTLEALCSQFVEGFKKVSSAWESVAETVPEAKGLQAVIVGIRFPREKPGKGRVLLKRGDTIVASADLAETGPVTWTFDQYDPKTHRLVWEPPGQDSAPAFQIVPKWGKNLEGLPRAIFLVGGPGSAGSKGSAPSSH